MRRLLSILFVLSTYLPSYGQVEVADTCEKISSSTDDFTGAIIHLALIGKTQPTSIHKTLYKGTTTYSISFQVYGSTLNVDKQGLTLLLQNGEKVEFPKAKIAVEGHRSGWIYSTSVDLSVSQMHYLSKNKVSKYRLFVYDGFYSENESAELSSLLNCLLTLK